MEQYSTQLDQLFSTHKEFYTKRNVILSFEQFIGLVRENPRRYMRNSPQYLQDVFGHYGEKESNSHFAGVPKRFSLFDIAASARSGPIIGGEYVQREIYNNLLNFVRQGFASKLLLLHGPNGSAKTSTVETISHAMEEYSLTDEGSVYRFNWIFPADKAAAPLSHGESGPIGFGVGDKDRRGTAGSFATLEDHKIASKIVSEFKENPLFLLPMPYREHFLRGVIAAKEGCREDDVAVPEHILMAGLSKRNQQIFENLLNGYNGNLEKVLCHVQVERFFFSKQYKIGIATVEPQISMDLIEKQITMDKNFANLPSILQTMNFFQTMGELVDANRGILEFSDLLKRPIDAFKYLLATIETGSINLATGRTNLDLVFIASTNEKHLDSFKTIPDFSSFRGRFELITVPYLLQISQEEKIYKRDIEILKKSKPICPHTLRCLCAWSVMTRLKQPDPEKYRREIRELVSKIGPWDKAMLYDDKPLEHFSKADQQELESVRSKLLDESKGMIVYEGRFGASPREIKGVLYRAAQNESYKEVLPMAIFAELEELTKDRTVYEFLQFEPRGQYHDALLFIKIVKNDFAKVFEAEAVSAMAIAEEREYELLLKRYIENVVAEIKREKIYNPNTNGYEEPSQKIMSEIEKVIGIKDKPGEYRGELLNRLAAYKLEKPDREVDITVVFSDLLTAIKDHFYKEHQRAIDRNFQVMLAVSLGEGSQYERKDIEAAENTFKRLQERNGYTYNMAVECVKFLMKHKKEAGKT